jgi:hypothetical protein
MIKVVLNWAAAPLAVPLYGYRNWKSGRFRQMQIEGRWIGRGDFFA